MKEDLSSGEDVGWGELGVSCTDCLVGSLLAADARALPGSAPGLPGTCILAISWPTLWLASSWLFCRAPQATSRSRSSCFSFSVSSDNLGATAAGHSSPVGQRPDGEPQGSWWGPGHQILFRPGLHLGGPG